MKMLQLCGVLVVPCFVANWMRKPVSPSDRTTTPLIVASTQRMYCCGILGAVT